MAGTFAFPTFAALAYPATPSSADKFRASYNVVGAPALSVKQRRVLDVVNAIVVAQNLGEARDYTGNHAGLISDSRAFTCGLSNFEFRTALTVLLHVLAKALSAGKTNDISTMLNTGKDFAAYSEAELDRMIAVCLYRSAV